MEKREGRERAERSDKKIRVNASLSKLTHEKLDRMATACGITKTSLAAWYIDFCLNNESMINFTQQQFKEKSRFRIIPSKINGELKFIFSEKLMTK